MGSSVCQVHSGAIDKQRTHKHTAIQAARLNGFAPIITTASLKHEAYLKSLGATHVVDRSQPDDAILAALPTLTSGAPISYAFEAVGRPWSQRLAYAALGAGGAYASVLPGAGADADIADLKHADDGKRVARAYGLFHLPGNRTLGV